MKLGLTFDDVALVPQYNNVESRTIPSLDTWLTKTTQMKIPIVAANMDTVIGSELAEVLTNYGSIPLFHRFTIKDQIVGWVLKYPNSFISVGLGTDDRMKLDKILDVVMPKGLVLDIAHGHDCRVKNFIYAMKKEHPILEIIAGNVCTPQGYADLVNAGADAVKVGVGPGAACTTRMVTGFGVPQFTAVYEIGELAKKLRVPIIADGGIRNSRDIMLALAAGASSVMIGKLFAATAEGAGLGVDFKTEGVGWKHYRGQASREFQEDYFGQVKEGTVPEGIAGEIKITGTASELLDKLLGGVRSGLTYGGARDIKELQRKAEFMQVTNAYHTESGTRL